jgi:hypothetical protein
MTRIQTTARRMECSRSLVPKQAKSPPYRPTTTPSIFPSTLPQFFYHHRLQPSQNLLSPIAYRHPLLLTPLLTPTPLLFQPASIIESPSTLSPLQNPHSGIFPAPSFNDRILPSRELLKTAMRPLPSTTIATLSE